MTIRSELEALQKAHPLLAPETAVAWAKAHPQSALHQSLEWDDATAGNEYRIWQIRQLIAIHVRNEAGVRQLISLKMDRVRDGGGYRSLESVMAKPKLRQLLLDQALAELDRVKTQYENLSELAAVWMEVEKVKSKKAA